MIDTIVTGDCLSEMDDIATGSVDMVLCDLPYGVTSRNKWDHIIPFEPLWNHYLRIAKHNAAFVFTATEPFGSKLIQSQPKLFRYDLIWRKNKVTGFLNAKKMPLRTHENILVFYRALPIYNPQKTTGHKPVNSFTKHSSDGTNYGHTKLGISGGGQTDRHPTSVMDFAVVNNDSDEKFHSTQKPVALFEWLIKTYSNRGDTVLDNCIGSGTTAIACHNTDRHFIGIEADADFARHARRRYQRHIGKAAA